MTEAQVTEKQPNAQRASKRAVMIAGVVLLLMGLYISAFLIPDVLQNVGGPQAMSLSEAGAVANSNATYARIEDGDWDCETLRLVRGLSASSLSRGWAREETRSTEVFYTDNRRDVVVFVTLSGEVECSELAEAQPTGYLYDMDDGTRQNLTNDARLARYFTADTFLEFCGYCGQENSLIGAGFGIAFVVFGGALLVLGMRMKKAA